tara:strand:- start:445 stop:636 length:192 start_codon:yes stop_codon:yes gene_type:complete
MKPCGKVPTMAEFKALQAGLDPHLSTEMDGSVSSDPETGLRRVVEISADYGVTLTNEDFSGFL